MLPFESRHAPVSSMPSQEERVSVLSPRPALIGVFFLCLRVCELARRLWEARSECQG